MAGKSDFGSSVFHWKDFALLPEKFNDPFSYLPCEAVKESASEISAYIDSSDELAEVFGEGKMLGVLVVEKDGKTGYLAGFSGNAGGRNVMEGFVPPIFDLLAPSGIFKTRESEISAMNAGIRKLEESEELSALDSKINEILREESDTIAKYKAFMSCEKEKRKRIRENGCDGTVLGRLEQESRFQKAELKRIAWKFKELLKPMISEREKILSEISRLKDERRKASDELQKWIFGQFRIRNFAGETKDINAIFAAENLVPPAGTGECAAPKMLQYAFEHGFRPVAIGEFWFGRPSSNEVRCNGRFYPSCTSKCGPLLRFMLKGMEYDPMEHTYETKTEVSGPHIVFEDKWLIAASKPSGMPSVPGKNGLKSMLEWLCELKSSKIFSVHRLDMDTSGIMLFAKDEKTAAGLRKQFEQRSVMKTYHAMTDDAGPYNGLGPGDKGRIELPLCPDYENRPRQKVDYKSGYTAVTEYEIEGIENGSLSIRFHPVTGRTHQLRIHSAHKDGIGVPIKGDRLYGSLSQGCRLHLHASSITFIHPVTGKRTKVEDPSKPF